MVPRSYRILDVRIEACNRECHNSELINTKDTERPMVNSVSVKNLYVVRNSNAPNLAIQGIAASLTDRIASNVRVKSYDVIRRMTNDYLCCARPARLTGIFRFSTAVETHHCVMLPELPFIELTHVPFSPAS